MADTSGCCGGPKGRHLDGCNGVPVRGRSVLRPSDSSYLKDKGRQKANAKLKNVGKPRQTAFMDAEIPQGHRQVKNAQGLYVIIKK